MNEQLNQINLICSEGQNRFCASLNSLREQLVQRWSQRMPMDGCKGNSLLNSCDLVSLAVNWKHLVQKQCLSRINSFNCQLQQAWEREFSFCSHPSGPQQNPISSKAHAAQRDKTSCLARNFSFPACLPRRIWSSPQNEFDSSALHHE